MADPVLSTRQLNRTLLERQHLLERSAGPLPRVIEDMGGIQMQYAPAGYIALWSRMRDFQRPMLTRALEAREVIQATLLRATIHTVSAADYWPMMAGIRRINREWYGKVQAAELAGIDMQAAATAVRELLEPGPLRMSEILSALVGRGFPERAAKAVGLWVDLVRVTPSGTWERRRADLYGRADTWIPPVETTEDDGMELLVRRYLGAFGPAPARDIASWMGVNIGQMRHALDRLELRAYRDPAGKPLVDLADRHVADEGTEAPPRFIGVWDAMLLVHARRAEVLPEAYRPSVFNTRTPHSVNTFLVDGQVAGTWRFEDGDIGLSFFGRIRAEDRVALEDEAHRLTAFHA